MASELAKHVIDIPIMTKMATLKEMATHTPKESVVNKIQAVTTELVMLQYKLREYAVLEWYENKLNDRQKELHNFFEKHIEPLKLKAQHDNWVVLSDHKFKVTPYITNTDQYSGNSIWYGFINNIKNVDNTTKEFNDTNLEGMLFVPLFSVNK